MTNALRGLGRLALVPPREVWPHEAHDFTPWLLANADVLSDLLGMELDLEVAEHPVGGFSLDLFGHDTATGRVVIVENQLEVSDHTHLGQILTYAAGTDPATIVWVAPAFRPEHRAALDWLNTRTDEHTRFFGVEIAVVCIGDSELAPMFKLIAQPNDWEKTVRATLHADGLSKKAALYSDFWTAWLKRVQHEQPAWSRARTAPSVSWFAMTTGTAGATFYTSFTRQGLSSELVFEDADADVNTRRFAALKERRVAFEAAYGGTLEFQELPDRKSTRIAEYRPVALIEQQQDWSVMSDWLMDHQARLRSALIAIGGVAMLA